MAGGHRCMGREDDLAGNSRHGLLEAQTLVFHAHANRFEHGETTVSFVHVQHARRDPHRF